MCNCTSCSQVYELPQSHYGDNWEVTLFWWFHINITFVKLLQEMSALDHLYWSPYLNTSYIVMSYKKVIDNWEGLVFHDFIYIYIYIYIILIFLLWDLSTLSVVDCFWPLMYIWIHFFIYRFLFSLTLPYHHYWWLV